MEYPPMSKEQASNLAKHLRKQGVSLEAISMKLKQEGYQTRTGKPLAPRTILNMLTAISTRGY